MSDNTQEHMNNSGQSTTYAQGSAQAELDEIFTKYTKQVIDMCHGNRPDVADESAKAKQALLDWHNKQVKNAVATAEDNLDQYWNKELNKQVEAVLDRLEAQFVEEVVVIFGKTEVKKQVPLSAIEAERNKLKEAEL